MNRGLGTKTLIITGASGNQTATTTVTLGIYTPTFTLYSYGANVGQGSSATRYVFVNPETTFNPARKQQLLALIPSS